MSSRVDPEHDATDPYRREAQTFPVLSEEMARRVSAFGVEETPAAGALLFVRGERSVDFFLVLQGAVEIFDVNEAGKPNVFTVHRARQFTGELDLFNDRQILVSGRAAADTRVVRVHRADFHRMVIAEPDIGEIIMRAFILRRVGLIRHAQGGVILVGPGHTADTLRLQRFLTRNGYPHRLLDTQVDPDTEKFLACFELKRDELPVVVSGAAILRNPTSAAIADALGISEQLDPSRTYDLAVVGAGPAGLAAAVYAASEGLSTIVLEALAPGGQAGTSSKIENYLGFPTGISGQALAGRAQVQAQKFGAKLVISRAVVRLHCDSTPYELELEGGVKLAARSVVIATGARYRSLDVANYAAYEGQGVHYAATAMEAQLCSQQEVIVVGGGNSAGQAALFLSRHAGRVHVLVRGGGLAASMSDYLIQRIAASPRINVVTRAEITALDGVHSLQEVAWTHRLSGETTRRPVSNMFVMIGASPNTEWVRDCLELDPKGFVLTGSAVARAGASAYETSLPGVFAVGDVRSGSTKRVASAVGEGSVVVQSIHRFLAALAA